MRPITRCLLGSLLLAALSACAPTPWKPAFIAEDPPAAPLAPDGPVAVRELPWARMQNTLKALETEIAASDIAPSEWPPQKRLASRAAFLRGMQVTADPASVAILGRSEFRTTTGVSPADERLADFARAAGADLVVWSRLFLGKAETVRQEFVTEYRSGTWWAPRTDRDRARVGHYSERSTTTVPVRVQEDEWAWVFVFMRTQAPG